MPRESAIAATSSPLIFFLRSVSQSATAAVLPNSLTHSAPWSVDSEVFELSLKVKPPKDLSGDAVVAVKK